jgi:hypothetical protein
MKKSEGKKSAGVMTTTGNVKTEKAPHVEPEHISVNEEAKRIEKKAKSADSFEYDDHERAQQVFDKLPEGEFVIKEGDKTVIQKL